LVKPFHPSKFPPFHLPPLTRPWENTVRLFVRLFGYGFNELLLSSHLIASFCCSLVFRTSRRLHAQVIRAEFGLHDGLRVALRRVLFVRNTVCANLGRRHRRRPPDPTRGMETTPPVLRSTQQSNRQGWTADAATARWYYHHHHNEKGRIRKGVNGGKKRNTNKQTNKQTEQQTDGQ